jgi:uncharacterized protein HemY
MVEASVQGFLRTILILILVYYALKWLGRILFPVLFQKAMKNFEEKARQQQDQTNSYENVKEGETVIDRRPKPQRESNKNVGEYVDYEEID